MHTPHWRAALGWTALIGLGATGCRDTTGPDALLACAHPAPLYGHFDPAAPDYIVVYRDGTDAVRETQRLSTKYAFTPIDVWTAALDGFAAPLTDAAVSGLRCEASVKYLEHDAVFQAF